MGERIELLPILQANPFFYALDPQHLGALAACATLVDLAPGTMITQSARPADVCVVIRRGRVAIEITPPGRGAVILETLADGDVIGWSWLFPPYAWNLDARALETVQAIVLEGRELRARMDADPVLGYALHKLFTQVMLARIRALRDRLATLV